MRQNKLMEAAITFGEISGNISAWKNLGKERGSWQKRAMLAEELLNNIDQSIFSILETISQED